MSEKIKQRPHRTTAGEQAATEREARLAAALRANLHRRKAQARERQDGAEPAPNLPATRQT